MKKYSEQLFGERRTKIWKIFKTSWKHYSLIKTNSMCSTKFCVGKYELKWGGNKLSLFLLSFKDRVVLRRRLRVFGATTERTVRRWASWCSFRNLLATPRSSSTWKWILVYRELQFQHALDFTPNVFSSGWNC